MRVRGALRRPVEVRRCRSLGRVPTTNARRPPDVGWPRAIDRHRETEAAHPMIGVLVRPRRVLLAVRRRAVLGLPHAPLLGHADPSRGLVGLCAAQARP